jgi:hypothetical protein
MSRVLIIACSQRKVPGKGQIPALDRYDGPAFRVLRKYLRDETTSPTDVLILSAKYGLIPASRKIPDYDCRMSAARAKSLREKVLAAAKTCLGTERWDEVGICLGKHYRAALNGFEQFVPIGTRVGFILGGQGARLTALHEWLRRPSALRGVPEPV